MIMILKSPESLPSGVCMNSGDLIGVGLHMQMVGEVLMEKWQTSRSCQIDLCQYLFVHCLHSMYFGARNLSALRSRRAVMIPTALVTCLR